MFLFGYNIMIKSDLIRGKSDRQAYFTVDVWRMTTMWSDLGQK